MTPWKRNLGVIWVSQFFSICGFSLSLPFAPFFIQQLGVSDPDSVKMWAALAASATGVGLAIMSPLWGTLADRYGRRLMMLRATFAAGLILLGMAYSPSPAVFVFLRFLQGMFTGTVGASTAFVASTTPQEHQGKALGSLSTAMFMGLMVGPALGGLLSEEIGYRHTFQISSVLLFISWTLVLSLVREDFDRSSIKKAARPQKAFWQRHLTVFGPGAPILLLLLFVSIARSFDRPIIPLYVQELHGTIEGASRLTGLLNALAAVGAALAGFFLGRLSDRHAVSSIGKLSALGSGIAMLAMGAVPLFSVLFPARLVFAFCAGGLDPLLQIWLSKVTQPSRRATLFGWAVTAKSLGWASAPVLSGLIAVSSGFRVVFTTGAVLFWCLIPLMVYAQRHVTKLQQEAALPQPNSPQG